MNRFSANLGFLWKDLPLVDAIHAAAQAGFDAVECHWPFATDAAEIKTALRTSGLPMLSLNTVRGDVEAQEFGLAAVPGREALARVHIEQAIHYASVIGCPHVHVLAGKAQGGAAKATFLDNLKFATDIAAQCGITILIEPINTQDMPGYFLCSARQAIGIIDRCGTDNLKLMFDCYHVHIMDGSVLANLTRCFPYIGHIQFSAYPGRRRPDLGEIDYIPIFKALNELGWRQPLGAEYIPDGPTQDDLGWMNLLR